MNTTVQSLFQQGLALHQRGDVAGAGALYARVLAAEPKHFDALHMAGVVASQNGEYARALELFGTAIPLAAQNSGRGAAYNNRAIAFTALGRYAEALADLDQALAAGFRNIGVLFGQAMALHGLGRLEEAVAAYDVVLKLNGAHVDALYQRGLALYELGRLAPARDSVAAAVQREPGYAPAHNGLGLALSALGEDAAALRCFDTAIRLQPNFPSPHINRSVSLRNLGQREAALESLNRAIALQPDNVNAHANRATLLMDLKRREEAAESLRRALSLNADYPFLRGMLLHFKMYECDWTNLAAERADLFARVARGEPASTSSALIGLTDSAALLRKAAEAWATAKEPENPALGPVPKYARHDRLRIGYYSSDFWAHATAHLMAGLFECHDRSKFDVTAFSFGPDTGDAMQKRLIAGCERFIDVRSRNDREVAALSREMEIDIAIDLKGFTEGYRAGIFAHRAAPIQASFLGYPCTMAAPYMDYIIADDVIIPPHLYQHYSEKVIALPGSYQINDRKRIVSDRVFTRRDLGLPDSGFVFCSFNNNYKIIPEMFDVWVRILQSVQGSVLLLIEDSAKAAANLRREAASRGLAPERLVFVPRVAPEDHLARQRAADLFLDTFPCNAHTTASDALWVGLPVLTLPGEGLASRVAASLLTAIETPELIAPDVQAYERLAVDLAKNPGRLAALRRQLDEKRLTAPLFDTELFARNLEAAYMRMLQTHHN